MFMEDIWQFGIQYFYVDKFAGQSDEFGKTLIALNSAFLFIKIFFFLKSIICLIEKKKWRTYLFVLQGLFPSILALSRAYGGIYQVYIIAPRVRGACLR